MYKFLLSFLLFLPLGATEFAPWFTPVYEFEPRLISEYAHYGKVNTLSGNVPYSDHDYYFDLSLSLTPHEAINLEIELQTAQTRARSYGIDCGRLTGRYLWLDDVGGRDPIALATGVTFSTPLKQSLRDISVFHHWYLDTEAHIAVGKERACGPFWSDRAWLLFGYGFGNKGSSWLHGLLSLEKNLCDRHSLRLFGNYLLGLGTQNLLTPFDFPGYASLAHRSFDASFGYGYKIAWLGSFNFDFTMRLYARNCPSNVRAFTLTILIPFAL